MKLFQFELTTIVVIAAEDQAHALQIAESGAAEFFADDISPRIELDGEVTSLDQLRHGWDGECIPYGGDGRTRLDDLLPNARIEPTRHLAEILQEEMDERGWTKDDLALRMGPTHDDFGINRLALDLFMEVRKPNVILGAMDVQFAIAFGVSKEFFNNLHEAWRAAQRQEKSDE